MRRKGVAFSALVVLVAFDAYTAFVLVTAVVRDHGDGTSVFWTAVALLCAALTGAVFLTRRVAHHLLRREGSSVE
jgi:hypothetical protein